MTAIFVHGVPETSELWDEVRAVLNAGSVALRLPGFGCMVPNGFTASKDGYANWLADEIRHFEAPIDLVGHGWGGLLCVRVSGMLDSKVRSWTIDMARALHPDYVWNRVARTWQTPGAGEEWMEAALRAGASGPVSTAQRLRVLGIPSQQAESMASAHDETMSRCILGLYRSAIPNVSADWGASLARPTGMPGLVLFPSADPFDHEALSRVVAARLGARIERLEGLGHCWMTEDPGRSAGVLRRFWSSLSDP
ncbi:MAG TPA: alpha/beta hydrolase [Gaiellales bacterium]|jgi:pimeloyl-ACP methyl ester carboxylesterase|nr:alpha/beta hydrolase [Gaiellales bacterium]